jgi:hypothetical protein
MEMVFPGAAAVLLLASAALAQTPSAVEADQLARYCRERAGFSQHIVEEQRTRFGDTEFARLVETNPFARFEAGVSKLGPLTIPTVKVDLGGQCVGFRDAVERFMNSRETR